MPPKPGGAGGGGRNSSLGGVARRAATKAHIPYRGDNPEVGKKTGIAVEHVERKSDGFEPFDALLMQADGRTPPRPKARKSRASSMRGAYDDEDDDEDEDEDGEMSMQLDSPVQVLSNVRPPTTPTSHSSRRRPSAAAPRPVARTSDLDFDQIPSPQPLTTHQRRAGPSKLSQSARRAVTPESEYASTRYADDSAVDMNTTAGDFDDYSHVEEDEQPPETSSPADKSTRSNFSRIEAEDDEDEEEEEEQEDEERTPRPSYASKSTVSAASTKPSQSKPQSQSHSHSQSSSSRFNFDFDDRSPEQDDGIEDDIAQGLAAVDEEPPSEEEEDVKPKKKGGKNKEEKENIKKRKAPSSGSTSSRVKKENQDREYREGSRRSKRAKIGPLDWWRGERCVYGKTPGSGPMLVVPVKEIIRLPKETPQPLGGKKKKGRGRSRSKSVAHTTVEDVNPEEGWDDDTQAKCPVLHFTTREEVVRRIAWTAKMVEPRQAADNSWSFDKIFGDDDFIAAGQLIIPVGSRKPSKAAKDNTYIFYVIEGAVNLKIHETSMVLATGGMFMVPRGNTYFIENICQRPAKLFFTQARKVEMSPEDVGKRVEDGIRKSVGAGNSRSTSVPGPGAKRSQSAAVGGK